MYSIAFFPVCTRGSRSVCMEFETASIPVKVPAAHREGAQQQRRQPHPSHLPEGAWKSRETSAATAGRSGTCRPTAYRSSGMWPSMNAMKIGVKRRDRLLDPPQVHPDEDRGSRR